MAYDLRTLLFEITTRCNAACSHCGSRCETAGDEGLSREDILSTLRDVKENLGTDVMINISGGEPLMRQDLFAIMSEVTRMGFDWGMVTNGSLITEHTVELMKASGMKTVTVSLDGLEHTHNSLRKIPDGYNKIIRGITLMKQADFLDCLQITFTANHKNVYEFPELYNLMKHIGIDSIRIGFVDAIGRAEDNQDLMLTKEEMEFLFWFVNKKNREGKLPIVWGCPHYFNRKVEKRRFNCFAGTHTASILANGDIYVCPNVPRRDEFVQGNIRRDSFSSVWKEGFACFRNRALPKGCEDCRHRDACAGDSLHSMDFDKDMPKFCYKRIFEDGQHEGYFAFLKKKYGELVWEEVSDEEDAPRIFLEPDVYEEIRQFFHMGKRHPLSMYEQQLGMVGFRLGKDYVIRYVFEDNGQLRYKDNAIFTKKILQKAMGETKIIKENYYFSDDRSDFLGMGGLRFLGFAHSHPIQDDLVYSVGDELIHRRMQKLLKGHYIGVLVHPETDRIGAYVGEPIKQGRLILLEKKTR